MISDVFWLLNGIVSWVRPGVAKSNKAWLICPILSSCDGKTNTKSRKVSVNPKVNWKIVIQFRSWDSSSENQFSIRPSENVQFFNITLLSLTLSAWVKRRQATLLADCAIARNHWFWHLVKNRFPRSWWWHGSCFWSLLTFNKNICNFSVKLHPQSTLKGRSIQNIFNIHNIDLQSLILCIYSLKLSIWHSRIILDRYFNFLTLVLMGISLCRTSDNKYKYCKCFNGVVPWFSIQTASSPSAPVPCCHVSRVTRDSVQWR